jgi:2-methylcitrate dehydratase PrpD
VGFLPGTDTALVSTNPKTALEGKFSIEYVLSALLLDGQLGLATFTDAMVNRPAIRDLMKKVKREKIPDAKIYSGISGYTDLMVKTTREKFQLRIEDVPGSIQWPLSADDKKNKFIDCAQRILGVDQANTVFQVISKLQHVTDIGQLMQAIVPKRERVEVINS